MTNTKQQNNTPRLRFPGFSGEWEEKKLGDIFTGIKSGKDKISNHGKYPVYGSTGIIGYSNNYTYEGNYVLVARVGANAGKINFANDKFGVTDNTLILEGSKDKNVIFFHHLLKMKNLRRLIFGSGQPLITGGQLKKIKICFPSLPEQQKIASFLGIVDEWITNLKSQKANLDTYKKGLMQKIFSQEIRFKDERSKDFPEWDDKKLGDTGSIITGTTPSTLRNEYYGGEFPWVTPTDIKSQKDIYKSEKFLTRKGIEVGRLVPKDSLLVTCIASIGKNAILRVKGSCNQQINVITPNKKYNVDFLYYLIEYNKNILIRFAGAGGMQMLNKKDFSGLKFLLPALPEQQKIANFLTGLDNLINLKQQQIDLAEVWKKGLMQGMFV